MTSQSSAAANPGDSAGAGGHGTPDGLPAFPFPFQPYTIQQDLMAQLYRTLSLGNVGVFESPTGTGKSLSIISAALTWLQRQSAAPGAAPDDGEEALRSEPAWVRAFALKRKREEAAEAREEQRRRLARQRQRVQRFERQMDRRAKAQRVSMDPDDPDLIDQALSEPEAVGSSTIAQHLYSSDSEVEAENDKEAGEEEYVTPKLFYCSRTHTQLNQFVKEIRRTVFWSQMRIVQLASRGTFCINTKLRQAAHQRVERITELCLDLQQAKPVKPKAGRLGELCNEADAAPAAGAQACPYLNRDAVNLLRDHLHVEPRDIEDLVALGQKMAACPYYATRAAVPAAHVVTLPYTSLLSRHTRESLGVDLQGCVVIIDEAHNIIETINAVHSREVTYVQLHQGVLQLEQYLDRYQNRLLPKNKAQIKQLIALLKKFLATLTEPPQRPAGEAGGTVREAPATQICEESDITTDIFGITEFLFQLNIDNVNLFEVERFIQSSEIIRKLSGILERQRQAASAGQPGPLVTLQRPHAAATVLPQEYAVDDFHNTQLHALEHFLAVLTGADQDGRLLRLRHRADVTKSSLRFVLLNPSVHFDDVTQAARSVILAGGTMQPIPAVVAELFHGIPPAKVDVFTCGHIVPKENLIATCLDCGPTGLTFDFTFGKRAAPDMIAELGRLLVNLVNITPDGMVVFFPSYHYENQVYQKLLADGVIARIEQKKKLFRESRASESTVDVLQAYCSKVESDMQRRKTNTVGACSLGEASACGAVLSCVIGGKLSEGINFSDHLGRCIVVVGLPYAPPQDPLLKEKMAYLTTKFGSKSAGETYYENLCMKGVNQSVGRAIRHAGDYASIVLVDHRYGRDRVAGALPQWIRRSVVHHRAFAPAFQQLRNFHASKLAAAR